ncbi:MAG: hypothetical protein KAI15_03030 [Gammaproteobacteria bacterium]|nr:hypothetical protein [Gammaproteobacteria bacterium]
MATGETTGCIPRLRKLALKLTGTLSHNCSSMLVRLVENGEKPTCQSALVPVMCISVDTWNAPAGKPARSSFLRGTLSCDSG